MHDGKMTLTFNMQDEEQRELANSMINVDKLKTIKEDWDILLDVYTKYTEWSIDERSMLESLIREWQLIKGRNL